MENITSISRLCTSNQKLQRSIVMAGERALAIWKSHTECTGSCLKYTKRSQQYDQKSQEGDGHSSTILHSQPDRFPADGGVPQPHRNHNWLYKRLLEGLS